MSKRKTIGKKTNLGEVNRTDEKNVNQPSTSEAQRAGTFDGDLRQLPSGKPVRQARPKLRQPPVKPRVYVKDAEIKTDN